MSKFRQRARAGMVAIVALGLAACASSTSPSPSLHPSPTARASNTASPVVGVRTFQLVGIGVNTYASGKVSVVEGTNSFTLVVSISGLTPNSKHVARIHSGATCGANGPLAFALQSVVADGAGSATTTSTIQQAYVVPSTGWYVNVYQGPDLVGANATPIACAVLQ